MHIQVILGPCLMVLGFSTNDNDPDNNKIETGTNEPNHF
jgi:hypothetical protein